jgi:hypothetical protein
MDIVRMKQERTCEDEDESERRPTAQVRAEEMKRANIFVVFYSMQGFVTVLLFVFGRPSVQECYKGVAGFRFQRPQGVFAYINSLPRHSWSGLVWSPAIRVQDSKPRQLSVPVAQSLIQ